MAPAEDDAPHDRRRLGLAVLAVVLLAAGIGVAVWLRQPDPAVAYCARIPEVDGIEVAFATGDAAALDGHLAAMDDIAADAPEEVADDLAVVRAWAGDVRAAVAGSDDPAADAEAFFESRREQVDDLTAASAAVVAYTATTCGRTLGTAPDGTVAPVTATAPGGG